MRSLYYIIAYGSLMENQSKAATDSSSGENIPVTVDHYQRGWFAKGVNIGLSTTYLAIIKKQTGSFNVNVQLNTPFIGREIVRNYFFQKS